MNSENCKAGGIRAVIIAACALLFTFHFSLFTLPAIAQERFELTGEPVVIDPPTYPQFGRWWQSPDTRQWQYQVRFSNGWWVYTASTERWDWRPRAAAPASITQQRYPDYQRFERPSCSNCRR